MSNYIKEIYRLRKKPYKELMDKLGEQVLMEQLRHFIPHEKPLPVTAWVFFYYLDNHADKFMTGNRKHHIIAKAIYESMGSRSKREVIEYLTWLEEEDD